MKKNAGVTLIEALIWFAIFATIVAAVFVFYSKSQTKNNSFLVNKQLSTIYREANNVFDNEPSNILNNLTAMQYGLVPKDMQIADASTGKFLNVFGGNVTIAGLNTTGFTVTYTKIPVGDACVNIVDNQKRLGWNNVNSTIYYNDTYNMNSVASLCANGSNKTIDLTFNKI